MSMAINRPIKSLLALVLVLAVAAALVATQVGGGSQASGASSGSANPAATAVPPILRSATQSDLAGIRRSERQESGASNYKPSAGAGWSTAETNAYPKATK